ncbi:hypothetical protein C8263_12305 [Deinococcus arcticus]|uniref:Uncharacterized protein n=2 Tax=Deinococcus arcticus TaxID=2136176 RepID=A0A2T3W6T5_9DEIO|nr:hypothetical protein C8263_12305 [Deinococcus arcticus]
MTGTTKAGMNVQQIYTLRGRPDFGDDLWIYSANGRKPDNALLFIEREQDVAVLVEETPPPADRPASEEWMLLCLTAPKGPGWASAKGLLLHSTADDMSKLLDSLDSGSDLSTFAGVAQQAGTCTVRRL